MRSQFLYKSFVFIVNMPIYFLSFFVVKNKNIWVFGSWFGDKYGDSPKYLFEYVNKNHPEIRCIWLTRNPKTLHSIRAKSYEVYSTYSFSGYFFSAKAAVSVVSTGYNDVNRFIPTKFVINTWHGIALKKILYDDKISNFHREGASKNLIRCLFPFLRKESEYSLIAASSETEARNLYTAFRVGPEKVVICGLPRNDVFTPQGSTSAQHKIIYMPTHRNEGEIDIQGLFAKDIVHINKILVDMDVELHIKLHYYHAKDNGKNDYSNIKFIVADDVYSIINEYSMLITDYSSIYFDFLLTGRPIIFAPFDINYYLKNDREMYFEYNDVTPGPKCMNWVEVAEWISKFKEDINLYSDERRRVRNKFHLYQDCDSTKRLCGAIFKLIG